MTTGSVHQTEQTLFFVLQQLVIIIIAARIAANAARSLGQPAVVGEIIVGLLLGPSLFGRLCPQIFSYVFKFQPALAPMQMLSQIGLILLMFQIGLDFDFSHLREAHNRRAVLLMATASILLPFALGLAIAKISAPYLAVNVNLSAPVFSQEIDVGDYALFMATAFSITAIPILGRIMAEFGLNRTRLGAVAITSAAINDVIGWILLAVISAMVTANYSNAGLFRQLGLLAAYTALCWFVVKPALIYLLRRFKVSETHLPRNCMALILGVVFASAIATYSLGIFAIFGGFMIGVLLYREHAFVAIWKERVGNFVTVFFLPIFFTYTGLRTNVNGLNSPALWGWCALIIAGATAGKFIGAYAAARVAGMSHPESACAGIMMNTRALMELIILNVGYDLGVIPPNVFTMLVLMAIFSTVITAPFLRFWLPKMGHAIPPRQAVLF